MSKYVYALLSIYYSMFSQLQFPSVILLVHPFMNSSSLPDTWQITGFEIANQLLLVSGYCFLLLCVSYNPHTAEMHQPLPILWLLLGVNTACLYSLVLFTIQKLREIALERKEFLSPLEASSLRLVKGWLGIVGEGAIGR